MKTHSLIFGLVCLFALSNCSSERSAEAKSSNYSDTTKKLTEQNATRSEEPREPHTEEVKAADEAGNAEMEAKAALQKKQTDVELTPKMNLESQKGRKFVRTADVKGKVKNVFKSTMQIEDITAEFKGFITSTDLKSTVVSTENPAISPDTLLEIKHYVMENNLTIRVPNEKMDSLMRKMGNLLEFIDYRVIKADDVSLQLLANEMQQKRFNTFENRYTNAIDNRGKKLDETAGAEENLLNRQLQSDQSKIQKMQLEDQIAYSTIQLHIYQRETVTRELYANDKNIEAYRPSLWSRIKDGLFEGWKVVEYLVVFIFQMWWFWIVAAVAWIGYRKFMKNKAS